MNSNEVVQEKRERRIVFTGISLLSVILVPLFIVVPLLYFILTSSFTYVSLLKNARLVESFVHARNWQMEQEIRDEIEKKLHLEEFRVEFKKIKEDYLWKQSRLDSMKKISEFERLKAQRKELSRLSWEKAPGIFKDEDEFLKYRVDELQRFDLKIAEIEKYRDQHEEEIERAEDDFDEAEEAYEDAVKTLADKEEEAGDIIKSHKGSFMGRIYSDVEIIGPPLTAELNRRLIAGEVKKEIEKYLYFLTHYEEQVRNGSVSRDELALMDSGFQESRRVRLPGVRISLWVDDEKNGILQKRHLLSEVFVDRIEKLDNLNNRAILVNLFRFSDSGLAERFSRSYLKKVRLDISDGVITMESMELTGEGARKAELLMKVLTWGKYAAVALPVAALLLLLFILLASGDSETKYRAMRRVLVYPGVIIIAGSLAFAALSFILPNLLTGLQSSPFMQVYTKRMFFLALVHILGPTVVLFTLLAIAGSFFKRPGNGKEPAETDAG